MSNWDPPSLPEPPRPTVETAADASPPPAAGSRAIKVAKIGGVAVGGLLAIGVVGAIFADPEPDSVATGDATATSSATTPIVPLADPATTVPTSAPADPPPATSASPPTTVAATVPPTTVAATLAPAPVIVATLPGSPSAPSSTTTPPPPTPSTWTVVSVTDGDTLDVDGPDGRWTIRLIGINSPERDECFADEATAALAALTTGRLVLVSDVSDTDQYGRKLRYVETVDGIDVGAELVRGGYAISRRYEPDTARNPIYEMLQAEAEVAGRGLWAPDACGPATGGVSIDLEIRYDADGNDNQNKNDEWVRFTNTGAGPLDLGGWQVADETASHRYTFRDLVLPPGAAVTLYTGCGDDTAAPPDFHRFWCNSRSAIWNNDGDTVFLRDPSGNNVITHRYDGN